MPRALFLCTSIVAAFQLHLAAAAPRRRGRTDHAGRSPRWLRVSASTRQRDRAGFVSEIMRRLYTPPANRQPHRRGLSAAPVVLGQRRRFAYPFRLPPDVWSTAPCSTGRSRATSCSRPSCRIGGRPSSPRPDRRRTTRRSRFSRAIRRCCRFSTNMPPPAFAAFGDAVPRSGGRVAVPGGAAARPLWEAAVIHAAVSAPDSSPERSSASWTARLAYLYGVVASTDAGGRAHSRSARGLPDRRRPARALPVARGCLRQQLQRVASSARCRSRGR